MARSSSVHLTAICALVSFAYISQSLERHSLTGRPRLSSVLILLFAGSLCLLTSLFSKWLPGAQGRFDGQQRGGRYSALPSAAAEAKAAPLQIPPRPRRLSLPMLVVCIVIRLEIFHRVNYQQQCSTPGIESFLCLLLWAYETLSNPRKWALTVTNDDNDPWGNVFTDIRDWFSGPRQTFFISGVSAFLFCFGTYLAVGQVMQSTYVCFVPLDSRAWTVGLQITGLFLDALIIILFWRMLAWSRTTKLKLRALGSTLLLSSISMALVWLGHRLTHGARPLELAFGSLYVFDIVIDSTVFATLAMSSALWVCDSATVVPSMILTCLIGLWTTVNHALHLGTWEQLSRVAILTPSVLIISGLSWFAYSHDVKTFIFLKRIHVVFLLGILMQWLVVYSLLKSAPAFQRHPLSDLIYKANIEQDRWLRHATTSHNLPVAIKVYQDRHDGRNPPPFFHEWYKLAKDTKVVDEFGQIDRDLSPFRKVPAKYLRQRVTIMAEVPGVETIIIDSGGNISHSDAGDDLRNLELDNLVVVISKFAKYLPEMILPINLSPTPRILPSWNEAQSTARADLSTMVEFIQSRTSARKDENTDHSEAQHELVQRSSESLWSFTSARDLQGMHLAACPPTSRSRTNPHWKISDFCTTCSRRHSKGPIVTTWGKSLEICYQPDIYHLHGFFMTNPAMTPLQELLPLFSASKMDGFSDIIFPLPSTIASQPDIEKPLKDREDTLFWRGKLTEKALGSQALRGDHKLRLMHLVTKPDPSEKVTMVLPFPDDPNAPKDESKSKKDRKKIKDEFGYESVSAVEASRALPFDVRLQQDEPCLEPTCALVQSTYQVDDAPSSAAYDHRFILLTDENDGPPRGVMGALKSASVPFVSTTFRTWYTERLLPWLHFVPIDTRFQALHTTLSYFAGTKGRPPLNGRETNMKEQASDAQWIASQGRKWADTAIGEKDMEVYMFRLLLEWGRLIDDERDKIGFWQDGKGELQSVGWTPKQGDSPAS